MKKIRIFAFPSHQGKERTSGVDFARIIQPMSHLQKHPDFEVTLFDIHKKTDWLWVAQNIDIIYFNYLQDPWGFAAMGAMARKHGVKMVMDMDDDLWDIRPDNSAWQVYHKGSEGLSNFTAICNEVDYITATSQYLRNIIISRTQKKYDRVEVFPNYIDLGLYKYRSPFKNDGQINLLHFGSTTHFLDLQDQEFFKGVNRIMREYPNVTLRSVGAFIPKFKTAWGQRYENAYGHQDIYQWIQNEDKFPKYLNEADILVVPLEDDVYNRAKSNIKWLEASSAKVPGVWQSIRQYEEVIDGRNGLLARNGSQWYHQIKKLIDNHEFRQKMGEKAFEDVSAKWQIQNHVEDYANFFKMVLDKG